MTVHVLHEGFAICGTMEGFPGEWPAGHEWTYAWDHTRVTCEGCLRKLQTLVLGQLHDIAKASCSGTGGKSGPACG